MIIYTNNMLFAQLCTWPKMCVIVQILIAIHTSVTIYTPSSACSVTFLVLFSSAAGACELLPRSLTTSASWPADNPITTSISTSTWWAGVCMVYGFHYVCVYVHNRSDNAWAQDENTCTSFAIYVSKAADFISCWQKCYKYIHVHAWRVKSSGIAVH